MGVWCASAPSSGGDGQADLAGLTGATACREPVNYASKTIRGRERPREPRAAGPALHCDALDEPQDASEEAVPIRLACKDGAKPANGAACLVHMGPRT